MSRLSSALAGTWDVVVRAFCRLADRAAKHFWTTRFVLLALGAFFVYAAWRRCDFWLGASWAALMGVQLGQMVAQHLLITTRRLMEEYREQAERSNVLNREMLREIIERRELVERTLFEEAMRELQPPKGPVQ